MAGSVTSVTVRRSRARHYASIATGRRWRRASRAPASVCEHVVLVEDIVDTGLTIDYLRRTMGVRAPESLRVATLLDKPSRREVEVPVEYVGFTIPDVFVVGYGLDLGELYRNLPYVAIYEP